MAARGPGGAKSKRGWLNKFMHGAFSSSWKPKFVVLGDGVLSWYSSDREGTKAERSFSVGLIKFAAAMESLGELPFVFEIVVGADKSYYFQARDDQELFEWLSALSRPRGPGLRKRRSVSFDASSENDDAISPRQDGAAPPQGVLAAVPPNPLDVRTPHSSPSVSSSLSRDSGRAGDQSAARVAAQRRGRGARGAA